MGTWGTGMQDSDQALDFLYGIRQEIYLLPDVQYFLWKKVKSLKDDPQMLLALVDEMVEHKVSLAGVMDEVVGAINEELTEERLADWQDETERKDSLAKLLMRVVDLDKQ